MDVEGFRILNLDVRRTLATLMMRLMICLEELVAVVANQQGDLRSRLEISLSEAVYGTEKHIQVQGRSIRVKVPPGVQDGNKLNLKGQGSQRQDGKRGALFLDVKIKPHPSFERQDLDLVTQVSVPIPTIVLGGKVRIPTLSQDEVNSVELTIPPVAHNPVTS